jgi:hypothetical protein
MPNRGGGHDVESTHFEVMCELPKEYCEKEKNTEKNLEFPCFPRSDRFWVEAQLIDVPRAAAENFQQTPERAQEEKTTGRISKSDGHQVKRVPKTELKAEVEDACNAKGNQKAA